MFQHYLNASLLSKYTSDRTFSAVTVYQRLTSIAISIPLQFILSNINIRYANIKYEHYFRDKS